MTQSGDGAGPSATRTRETAITLGLAALFVVWFLGLCLLKWKAYGYSDFDLPIFDQALWSTASLDGFFPSSIRFGSVFTDHVPLILVACVPLYWVLGWFVPGAVILVTLQVVAVASAALPLHLLARKEIGPTAAIAVAAAYLLHPATGYLVLFEFHPGALAVPLLCWTLWALHSERWRTFLVFAALALACREDVALPIAGIGVWALWRSWRGGRGLRSWVALRWSAVPIVAAVVWFALAVLVIIPAAQPAGHPEGASPFVWLYAHHAAPGVTSPSEIVGALLGSPIDAVTRSADLPHKHVGAYTFQLLAPTGGLALLSPVALLPALPTWFLNVTSLKTETSSICYQYTANVLPFLFLGTITSMAWLGRRAWLRDRAFVLPAVLVVSALASTVAWGKQAHPTADPLDAAHRPDAPLQLYTTDYVADAADAARDVLVARVPDDASLATTYALLHRVPMRAQLYSWHYVRSGHDPITGAPVTTPPVDYVLLDSADILAFGAFGGVGSGERQRAYLGGYGVIARAGTTTLFARAGSDTPLTALAATTESNDAEIRELIAATADLVGVGVDIEHDTSVGGPVLRVSWAASRRLLERAARGTQGFATHGTLWLRVACTRDGEEHETLFALSHGMHPISEWRGVDPDRPDEAFTVMTATYPVLAPPGRWNVSMTVDSTHVVRDNPLATFDMGEQDVR